MAAHLQSTCRTLWNVRKVQRRNYRPCAAYRGKGLWETDTGGLGSSGAQIPAVPLVTLRGAIVLGFVQFRLTKQRSCWCLHPSLLLHSTTSKRQRPTNYPWLSKL